MPKNNIEFRLRKLEECSNILDGKIDSILQNHLPHLSEKIITLDTKITVLTAINVGAIVIALILSKML